MVSKIKHLNLSSYSHLITGVDEALMLGLFIDGHNVTLNGFKKANLSFDGWFKISIQTLVSLSTFSKSAVISKLKKLEKLGYIERRSPQRGGAIKSTYYKLNCSKINELNEKADSLKVRIVRGYGDYKKEIYCSVDEELLNISKENVHVYIKSKE